jgi:hypothetical protein
VVGHGLNPASSLTATSLLETGWGPCHLPLGGKHGDPGDKEYYPCPQKGWECEPSNLHTRIQLPAKLSLGSLCGEVELTGLLGRRETRLVKA